MSHPEFGQPRRLIGYRELAQCAACCRLARGRVHDGGLFICARCEGDWITGTDLYIPIAVPGFINHLEPKGLPDMATHKSPPSTQARDAQVPDDLSQHRDAVERLLVKVEALPVGASTDPLEEARAAMDALRGAAIALVCPERLQPAAEATLRDFEMAVALMGLPYERIEAPLIALHESAIDDYPELAAVVRSVRGQRLVLLRARNGAGGDPVATAKAEVSALGVFTTGIAKQLERRDLLMPASGIIASVIPRMHEQLTAIDERHRRHAEAEAERRRREVVEREQAQQAKAQAERERAWAKTLEREDRAARDRREALEAYYRQYPHYLFTVQGEKLTGVACAERLRKGAEFPALYAAQTTGRLERRVDGAVTR
jgi:hypothetical protein